MKKLFKNYFLLVALASTLSLGTANALDLSAGYSFYNLKESDTLNGVALKASTPVGKWISAEAGASFLTEDELDLYPIDLGLKFNFVSSDCGCPLKPYLRAGASYIAADSTAELGGAKLELDGDFGAYAGGGVSYRISDSVSLFGEAVYRWNDLGVDASYLGQKESIGNVTADGIQGIFGLTYNFSSQNS